MTEANSTSEQPRAGLSTRCVHAGDVRDTQGAIKLADLEDAEAALAFGSSMAAEAATFLSHIRTDDQIVCLGDVYGGTFELLGENLPRLGIDTTWFGGSCGARSRRASPG
jgi:cystathionine gamma-synthase/methionine-gamma-lyase